jgi:hypothetical protein
MANPSIYMKKVALTVLAAAALISFGPSCAKHSWEETQVLHEGMHKAHGDAHGKADAHAPAAGHEEKKAAH